MGPIAARNCLGCRENVRRIIAGDLDRAVDDGKWWNEIVCADCRRETRSAARSITMISPLYRQRLVFARSTISSARPFKIAFTM
jgi:hypothetical protein